MKKILIVGGISKNIPEWISKSFEITHIPQQHNFKRPISGPVPDLVVLLKSWVSHKQCADARQFAIDNGIPFIISDGGISMALSRAAEQGITWFIKDVEKETITEEVVEQLDSAWESAYNREYEKNIHLEKRLKAVREQTEILSKKLEHVLESAEQAFKEKENRLLEIIKRQDSIISAQQQIIKAYNPDAVGIDDDDRYYKKSNISRGQS